MISDKCPIGWREVLTPATHTTGHTAKMKHKRVISICSALRLWLKPLAGKETINAFLYSSKSFHMALNLKLIASAKTSADGGEMRCGTRSFHAARPLSALPGHQSKLGTQNQRRVDSTTIRSQKPTARRRSEFAVCSLFFFASTKTSGIKYW